MPSLTAEHEHPVHDTKTNERGVIKLFDRVRLRRIRFQQSIIALDTRSSTVWVVGVTDQNEASVKPIGGRTQDTSELN